MPPHSWAEREMNYLRTAMLLPALAAIYGIGLFIGGESGALLPPLVAASVNLLAEWSADRSNRAQHNSDIVSGAKARAFIAPTNAWASHSSRSDLSPVRNKWKPRVIDFLLRREHWGDHRTT